jgi:hypothetical protein
MSQPTNFRVIGFCIDNLNSDNSHLNKIHVLRHVRTLVRWVVAEKFDKCYLSVICNICYTGWIRNKIKLIPTSFGVDLSNTTFNLRTLIIFLVTSCRRTDKKWTYNTCVTSSLCAHIITEQFRHSEIVLSCTTYAAIQRPENMQIKQITSVFKWLAGILSKQFYF